MVQRLAGVSNNTKPAENAGKAIAVVNPEGKQGNFKGVCHNCGKVYGYRKKQCLHPLKASAGGGGGGQNETCNFCHKKGHKEDACWKKDKSKAP